MKGWVFYIAICFLGALFIRSMGIFSHPLWVDEYSTYYQANHILKHGLASVYTTNTYSEHNNLLYHLITACTFQIWGVSQNIGRMPSVLLGSLVPVIAFLLAYRTFGFTTAIATSLLILFSYFEITWSRQARGYMLQQVLILSTILVYFEILKRKKTSIVLYVTLGILFFLGALTHNTFYILIFTIILHFLYHLFFELNLSVQKIPKVLIGVLLAVVLITGYIAVPMFIKLLQSRTGFVNNAWYYHAFLWREYTLITFLAIVGYALAFIKHKREAAFFTLYSILYLIFFLFIFPPYTSRYLLALFPIIYMMMAYTIVFLSELVMGTINIKHSGVLKTAVPLFIIIAIIANGDKFVTKPKKYYSVNHDFREIANIDYNEVYAIIKNKTKSVSGPVAVVDTWPDRVYWHMGYWYPYAYVFRWENTPGTTNGLERKTPITINTYGEKQLTGSTALFIGNVSDLQKAMQKYRYGFLFIDDDTLPRDVIEYAKKNLKKEIYLDHYPLDDNPYSIWPATLYSWGF